MGSNENSRKVLRLFWGVGALFATLLIALGFKIYFALETHQPVMTGDYYEIGRNFDGYLKSHRNSPHRTLQSPLFATESADFALVRGVNHVPVFYAAADPGGASRPLAGAGITLELSRRATVNENIAAGCVTDAAGRCGLDLNVPAAGYWEGRIEARDSDGRTVLRRAFEVE